MADLQEKLLLARQRLVALDRERIALHGTISDIESEMASHFAGGVSVPQTGATPSSNELRVSPMPRDEKVALFRSLFRGRDDVYALRFESKRTGKGGYQPACRNDWVPLICGKPQMKCSKCPNRDLLPVTDAVIISHLIGHKPSQPSRDLVVGVYPLLSDETCWFLAVDFDQDGWRDDVSAFAGICRAKNIPVAIERSRSGNGAHAWIFFSQPITASLARKLGSGLLTETMERRPEVGMDSYDRLFPNQDTMPKGGFGNLIALPFQGHAVTKGNTLFLDDALNVIPDQWAYLKSMRRLPHREVLEFVSAQTAYRGNELGVRRVSTEDNEEDPWTIPPSRRPKEPPLGGALPTTMRVVLANEIYIEKAGLPPGLRNRILRIAAFQNPEFYRNQAMRLPTYDTPRIISCAEDHGAHIGLPIGCLDDLLGLLKGFGIEVTLDDQRVVGTPIDATFQGCLRPEQTEAALRMLAHDTGVLAASTAFGKTVVAIHLLASRGVNTLILVHRKQLMDQWRERLLTFLDIDPKLIGHIGGGASKATGIIDVAMIQSLIRKGVVSDVVANYGHLIVDECHHISAPSFEQVARRCRAKFITGLSATVIRKDGHHPIILMQCGPIRFQTNPRTDSQQRPFEHRAIIQETSFSMAENENVRIHEIYAALITNAQRNQVIVEDAIRAVNEGRVPVLLTERRDHMDLLAALLAGKVEHLILLAGGMGKKQLRTIAETMASIPAGKGRLILATGKYLGEGFDDARLDTLFLAMPISWKGTLAQYAGRLHRLHDMKREVRVHDYADVNVPMLNRMFLRRLKGYHAIGYSVESIRPAAAGVATPP